MKKLALLAILCGSVVFAAGCAQTIATMSITEQVAANGDKIVTTTRSLSQGFNHTQTGSTDQILEKFK